MPLETKSASTQTRERSYAQVICILLALGRDPNTPDVLDSFRMSGSDEESRADSVALPNNAILAHSALDIDMPASSKVRNTAQPSPSTQTTNKRTSVETLKGRAGCDECQDLQAWRSGAPPAAPPQTPSALLHVSVDSRRHHTYPPCRPYISGGIPSHRDLDQILAKRRRVCMQRSPVAEHSSTKATQT